MKNAFTVIWRKFELLIFGSFLKIPFVKYYKHLFSILKSNKNFIGTLHVKAISRTWKFISNCKIADFPFSRVLGLEIQIISLLLFSLKSFSMIELWRLLLVIISFLPFVIVLHLKSPSTNFFCSTEKVFFNDLRHLSIFSTSIND